MRRPVPPFHDVPPLPTPVVVVGDVHLNEAEPAVADRFLAFLDGLVGAGGSLVLLGDVFELWAGPAQAARPFEAAVVAALRRVAESGVRIHFQGGNRDFAFDGAEGLPLSLWPDVVRTRWGDRTVLLTHGDLLCTADHGYLALRRVLRRGAVPFVLWRLPFATRLRLAEALRGVSMRSTRRSRGAALGIDYGEAVRWMEAAGADVLVAGHVHTGVHHRLRGDRPRDVLVLKDWGRAPSAVRFDGTRITLAPA